MLTFKGLVAKFCELSNFSISEFFGHDIAPDFHLFLLNFYILLTLNWADWEEISDLLNQTFDTSMSFTKIKSRFENQNVVSKKTAQNQNYDDTIIKKL